MHAPRVSAPIAPSRAIPLGWLALGLVLGSLLLAAGAGYVLAHWAGVDAAWVAALAAALGMALAAVPMGALLVSLARAGERSALPQPLSPRPVAMTRDAFVQLIEREWSRARRYGSSAALLLVGVDRFGPLADRHGAGAGEAVLTALLHDIAPTLRGADALSHWGEGQLAVFLAQADVLGSLDVAERIREHAERLEVHWPSAPPLRITASLGVAQLRPAHLHVRALVADLDNALATARLAGGNCVRAAPQPADPLPSPGARRNDQSTPKS